MASYLHIANDVQWAAILCTLPVAPQTFLEWSRLECLSYLANLAQHRQWWLRPYMVKIFGWLLQLPRAPQLCYGYRLLTIVLLYENAPGLI